MIWRKPVTFLKFRFRSYYQNYERHTETFFRGKNEMFLNFKCQGNKIERKYFRNEKHVYIPCYLQITSIGDQIFYYLLKRLTLWCVQNPPDILRNYSLIVFILEKIF